MNNLNVIILLAYNRPGHTEQVLQALKQNELADQSELIIFIDGPKENATPEQIQKNIEVQNVARKEQWCKKVEIRVSKENRGCRMGPIFGISEALKENEAVIVLEDDIVTSPHFLSYMNESLNYYKNFKSVFSISAFNFPASVLPFPDDYQYDVYVSQRQQNWGWGTWQDRWVQVNWDKSFIPEFLKNNYQVEAFNRGGEDLSKMLSEEFNGQSDAWDIQFSYAHFKHHAVSIIPCVSYTNNIGLDNSGTHTLNKKGLLNDLSMCVKESHFLDVLYEDKRIVNALYSMYYPKKRPLFQKIINRVSRILRGKNVFVIKKKVYC